MFLWILFSLKWYSLVQSFFTVSSIVALWAINESVFITINNFLLIVMINILTIPRAGWKIATWINKWTTSASINEQMMQNMMDSTAGWIL